MVPDAPAVVDRLSKLEQLPGVSPNVFDPEASVAQEHQWNLADLFARPDKLSTLRRVWPPSDPFTLYLLATLARFAYTPTGSTNIVFKQARDKIIRALDSGASVQRVTSTISSYAEYDLWRTEAGVIFAFQGTTALREWLSYVPPLLSSVTGIGTTTKVYAGIASQLPKYDEQARDVNTGVYPGGPPAIMTGHSLGGALAQLLAARINVAAAALPDEQRVQVRGVWTYGAPAFLSSTVDNLTSNTFDITCRVYLDGDPVPYATQFVLARLAGASQATSIFAPGAFRNADVTEHLMSKSHALTPMNATDSARFRTAAIKSLLPDNRDALVKALVQLHSIIAYTDGAYVAVKDYRHAPQDKVRLLWEANQYMDESIWSNPTP